MQTCRARNTKIPSLALPNSHHLSPNLTAQTPQQKTNPFKIKPIFRKTITWKNQIPSSITKYKIKGLSTIELVSSKSTKINFKAVKAFCKFLKGTKRPLSLINLEPQVNSQNQEILTRFINATVYLKKLYVKFTNGQDLNRKRIFPRLKRCKNLLHFEISFGNLANRIPFQQLKGLRNLQGLKIDLIGSDNIGRNHEANIPIFLFKFPRALKSLGIKFKKSNLTQPEMLSLFASNISQCNLLEFLDLDCSQISVKYDLLAPIFQKTKNLRTLRMSITISDLDNQNFAKNLEYLKNLIELDLKIVIDLPEDPSEKFIENFFKHLSSLTNLKTLKLELQMEDYPDEDQVYKNILLLKSLKNLHTISLSLHGYSETEIPFLQNFFKAFQHLSGLKSFSLFVPHYQVSHDDLVSLQKMFKELRFIQNLSLVFGHENLPKKSLEKLFESFAHFNLLSFLLHVKKDYSNDGPYIKKRSWKNELASLFSAIENFTSLSKLDLNLFQFYTTGADIIDLSSALKKLKELTSFAIGFFCSDARSLLSSLREKPKLKSLKLILRGEVTDEEIEAIVSRSEKEEEIEFLALILESYEKNLEDLYLDFMDYRMNERSLLALENRIKTLQGLRNLTRFLKRSKTLKKQIGLQLLNALAFPKNLETVRIKLFVQIGPQDFNSLLRHMGRHWNLKTLQMNSIDII